MSAVAEAVGQALIKQGNTGPVVEILQHALRDLGFILKGTGYFGPATTVAVRTFQRRAGLVEDGTVGPRTAKAIDDAAVAKAIIVTPPLALAEAARPLWLQAGLLMVGTKEFGGNADNPVIIDWAKEEGGEIAKEYTHDVIPWCSLGINHMFTKAGLEGTETLWALDWNADLMERRIGRRWPGVQLEGPAVGAIALMQRSGGGHVIVVVGRDQNNNIMGLGCNQSDAVNIRFFPPVRLNEGFWWPASIALPALVGISHLPLVTSDGKLSTNEA